MADPDTIERIIAVGLCRRHKNARRIKPSRGDGGLDVLVPVAGGSQLRVDNYQVKKFADDLLPSRKRQIRKSLNSAIKTHHSTEFGYEISRWLLALPMDLTGEQEQWLFDLAAELEAPFPVEVFGLTSIEELLIDAPNIREYYLGDGLERVREIMAQMASLTGLNELTEDPTQIQPDDATSSLHELHRQINSVDPHFDYDFEVTRDQPTLTPGTGLIASVVERAGPDEPYVTWHIKVKYDTALEDRSVPGGYTVHPERMTEDQRAAWERFHDYGVPVELRGNVVADFTMELPGGLGGPLPAGDTVLKIGPALGEFDNEQPGRSLWIIEDDTGAELARRIFTFRLAGQGLAGGEYRQGTDDDAYISVELFTMPNSSNPALGSMQAKLKLHVDRIVNDQRCAAQSDPL